MAVQQYALQDKSGSRCVLRHREVFHNMLRYWQYGQAWGCTRLMHSPSLVTVEYQWVMRYCIPSCQGYPGYFRKHHWSSMGLPEISRVARQVRHWCKYRLGEALCAVYLGVNCNAHVTVGNSHRFIRGN